MFIKTKQEINRTNNIIPLVTKNGYNYYQVLNDIPPEGAVEVQFTEVTSEETTEIPTTIVEQLQKQIDDMKVVMADIIGGAL